MTESKIAMPLCGRHARHKYSSRYDCTTADVGASLRIGAWRLACTPTTYVIRVDTSYRRVDEVLTVFHSLMAVAKLQQLLVGPPLITPNTYARQNVSPDDSSQLATRRWLTRGKKLSASLGISPIPTVNSFLKWMYCISLLIILVNYSDVSVAASRLVTICCLGWQLFQQLSSIPMFVCIVSLIKVLLSCSHIKCLYRW